MAKKATKDNKSEVTKKETKDNKSEVTKKETSKSKNLKKNTAKSTVKKDNIKKEEAKKEIIVEETIIETNNYKKMIITFILGLVIGLSIMAIFIPKRIAKLENGQEAIVKIGDENITADQLYNDMKDSFSVNMLINKIDNIILSKIYEEDNDMKTSINETADYYISMYETYYQYTEEQFLKANGFKNRDEFLETLKLDYRRNLYYNEYVKSLITEKEIKNYYKSNVFGDIETKYISIDASDNESNAKDLANEIINKLNDGSTYEEITKEYKSKIKYENLEYISFDNNLEESYINALEKLSNDSYSKEPVKGTSDYKIIFRGNQKEKAKLEDIKEKIINILVSNKQSSDSTLYYKALDKMRKENSVEILDTDFESKYNTYLKEAMTASEN